MTDPLDPATPADDRIMTRTEVASWLALSLPTLMTLVRKGEIPASRIGGEWRFWRPTLRSHLFPRDAPPEPQRHEPEIITIAELAHTLQLTGETVRARIEDGSIPATRIGNRWRIHWPTIHARLEAGDNFTAGDKLSRSTAESDG